MGVSWSQDENFAKVSLAVRRKIVNFVKILANMASSLSDVLLELRGKIDSLVKSGRDLGDENRRLKEENQDLRNEIKALNGQLQRKTLDSEFLEVSHMIADTPDALVLARRRIATLIRTIDKCIAMLEEGQV